MQFVELSKKVESDYAKIQNELTVCQKRLSVLEVEKTKLLLKLKEKEEAIITLNEQLRVQEISNQKNLESLSNGMLFSGQYPVTVNTGTHSSKTIVGNGVSKGSLTFSEKQSNQTQFANHKVKRSLPDYNDLIQVSLAAYSNE